MLRVRVVAFAEDKMTYSKHKDVIKLMHARQYRLRSRATD